MDIVLNFKEYLMTGDNPCSPVTAKNYIADVKNFIDWYQTKSNRTFNPVDITIQTFTEYKNEHPYSGTTIERHLSSLRKFFSYISIKHGVLNPFTAVSAKPITDPWNLRSFKTFLHNYNSSSLTIKNYTTDVIQFLKWLESVSSLNNAYTVNDKSIYNYITKDTVEEYKFRLQSIAKLSPSSINRKLTSLRRYIAWATEDGFLDKNNFIATDNITKSATEETNIPEYNLDNMSQITSIDNIEYQDEDALAVPDVLDEKPKTYSSFPPLRLLQKSKELALWSIDLLATLPILKIIEQIEYTKWTLTGKNIFTVTKIASSMTKNQVKRKISYPLAFLTPNFKKSFYAPLSISTRWLPLHQKLIHHIKHTRPKWYKIYHSYALVHYVHLGLLIIAVSLSSYITYDNFKGTSQNLKSVLAGSDYTRLLNYKGRLTDINNNPITQSTSVKFALYNNPKEKGSALVWQEIHTIKPDTNGNFTVSLGQLAPLSQNLFLQNEKVYLGIKIGDNPELMPRQQIPTTSYATSSDTVQGLRPITDSTSGEKNTLLALDSLGNLTIGGTASPVFQATGGVFALSGQTLLLGTNPGTDTDVIIAPDGIGKIDLQKPIQNSTEDVTKGELSGAVAVEDNFAITATTSGKSALYINQNGDGPLISAATGSTAKLLLEANGNLGIGTSGPVESLLQVADGNDGYGGTITAKDGGAILMASTGTPPLTIGDNTNGKNEANLRIFPNGEIDYNNSKSANPKVSLPTDKSLFITGGKGITIAGQIIPATDGMYNLGSDKLKWNKIYVNEIVTNSLNGTFGFMQLKDGIVTPANITNDFTIGGDSTNSAKFHVAGSGPNAGSLTTAGTISFSGATPKLTIKTNTRFDIETLGPSDISPTPKLSLLGNGNLGIGTTTPLFKLDLADSQNATSTALITNSSISDNASVLALKLGSSSPKYSNNYITFLNGSGKSVGAITGIDGSTGGVSYQTWGNDFAEYFKKTNQFEVLLPGDILCLDTPGTVSKCNSLSKSIVGVVSGQAGFIGNSKYQNDPQYILVGLIGQLPVTFSTQNGEIAPGDPLSVGQDGKAIKATEPGEIIGKALEGTSNSTSDKINVYITLSWHDPKAQISSSGLLNTPQYNSIEKVDDKIVRLDVLLLKGKEIISDSVEAATINATDITTSSLTVAGKSLNDYILEKVASALEKINTQEINSPVASINSIRTDIISPLSYDSEIALNFRKEVIQIQNTKTKKTIAEIDQNGNARFAGTITSQNASIAGTLTTNKLIADDVELSEKALAKIKAGTKDGTPSATYISNITNVYQSTSSGHSQSEQNLASNNPSPDTQGTPDTPNALSYIPSSSLSAQLAYVPELKAKFGTFEQGLMSFGPTSTSDISVAGQLSINGSLILADNSINVLGEDLELQPLRQGNLSIMSGRVKIDTDGNLDVEGNANFAKNLKVKDTLFASIISPLADSDLVLKLNRSENNPSPSFRIQDASGSSHFSVNELGEVIASGTGTFKKLIADNINVVRSAQADTSLTETIASASAGTATINKYQRERTIISPFVTKDSLIYISPISDTGGITPYIARQVSDDKNKDIKGSFTIQTTKPTPKDIKINWWIIN